MQLTQRPRRNRKNPAIREMLAENHLIPQQLIYPIFVCEGRNTETPILTLPGQSRMSSDILSKKINHWKTLGLRHFALFPQIADSKKDSFGREALNENGLLAETIKRLKDDHPDINLVTDVALDPFSSDGHDGLVQNGEILNDESVEILTHMALKQAEWGSDWVAPSDMMDGRIGAIRRALDRAGYEKTNILAYSAKYASCFYGPFRDALQSAPKFGDKKTYQMDPRNAREALREVRLDIQEGADMVMVKPGLAYLDIIARIKKISTVPVAAYNVSGEYAMIKAAAQLGALDEKRAVLETLLAFKRSGADVILTYFAPAAAEWLLNP
jgi:porphobilinogen synthase